VTRIIPHPLDDRSGDPAFPRREWLVTNGLGGYASGTVAGVVTRRYHGLLVAAMPAPLGRYVLLNHLLERVRLPSRHVLWLGDEDEVAGINAVDRGGHLTEFRLELGLPVWRYELIDRDQSGSRVYVIQKRLLMPYGQNTVHVSYRLIEGEGSVRLSLRPSVQFRSYEAPVGAAHVVPYEVRAAAGRYELAGDPELPVLRLSLRGDHSGLTLDERGINAVPYEMEASRGYDAVGPLWSPGYFRADLSQGQDVALVASAEPWETILALSPEEAAEAELDRRRRLLGFAPGIESNRLASELVLAADQFIVTPAGRAEEAARAKAVGEEVRTVIAGYHWFADWGRDTMISLEGLTLSTGRFREAAYILRTFGQYIRDGLIPNMFPDGSREGLYHTADATLWYFHAIERYVRATEDEDTLRVLLPKLHEIVRHHLEGTRFGIGVDRADGLLRQGAEGYQLTWMDAKVGDWVVTPRRGKAVEINALWYNALCLLDVWTRRCGGTDDVDLRGQAARVRTSFNERFWFAEGGYLYDVVDGEYGEDAACRPNQVFAIALDHAVLDEARWHPVMSAVRERLLTPVGLRSLAPGHPDYKRTYSGDLRARDAAYHQGTVWVWLIGPYVDAWLKVRPDDRAELSHLLAGFESRLSEACVGSLPEIFDAEPPYVPRGCVAQAWSVAEVLRAFLKVQSSPAATTPRVHSSCEAAAFAQRASAPK
jgi:predicted glycogen debranching enzyme